MNTLRKLALEAARAAAIAVTMDPSEARIHQLILFVRLSATSQNYKFSVKDSDQQTIAPGVAIGLQEKDGFLAARYKLELLRAPIINGKPALTAVAPISWPDPRVHTIAAGTASLSEAQALESIYSGKLGLTTNNDVRLEDMSTRDNRFVHQTQHSAGTVNMQTGCEYEELGGLIGMMGFEKNNFSLDLECLDLTHLAGDADNANYVMLTLDGAIIKSANQALFRQ